MVVRDPSLRRAEQVDDLLDALSHRLRRAVVHYFESHPQRTAASVDDLVGHLASRYPDSESAHLSVQLFHTHLPKLEAHGWIAFDRRENHVQYHGHDEAGRTLEDLQELVAGQLHPL